MIVTQGCGLAAVSRHLMMNGGTISFIMLDPVGQGVVHYIRGVGAAPAAR